jgi:AcrR family transcriptional regulator
MPTKTFHSLNEDKKNRIIEAGVLEFTYHEQSNASVNNIVKLSKISKGSFYQYFEDKDDFYWYIVMSVIEPSFRGYSKIIKSKKGDIFETEKEVLLNFLNIIDDKNKHQLIKNVFLNNYLSLQAKLLQKANTVYIDHYDLLIKYGFKGYTIKTKEDFLYLYEFLRTTLTNAISKNIFEQYSKLETIRYYDNMIQMLKTGLIKRGLFK